MRNILWVDDDVNKMSLLSDRVELERKKINVIDIDNVDKFLEFIINDTRDIDCIIFDMLMAPGRLNRTETQNGTRTGIPLYKELLNSKYKDVKVVIYSVFKKNDFGIFGENDKILFISKSIKSSEFANIISNLINNKTSKDEEY